MNTLRRIWEVLTGIPVGYYRDRQTLYTVQLVVRDEVERQNPVTMGAGHRCPYAAGFKRFLTGLEATLNV